MKRLLTAAAALLCAIAASAQAPAGFLTVQENSLVNASNVPVTNATACAQINASSVPVGARITVGKTVIKSKVCSPVVNGAYSLVLPDTDLTRPIHVKFAITVTDNTSGRVLQDVGYGGVQPATSASWCSAGVCNLDAYDPDLPALVMAQYGPKGDKGDQGIQGVQGLPGAAGSVVVNPVSGNNSTVLAGTILHVLGESNASGFGSSIPWTQLAVQSSDYFAGRGVVYHNWASLGQTASQMLDNFNTHVKPDCLAHQSDGVPVWLVVETSVNGGGTPQQIVDQHAAIWAAAKAAGCNKVFATTTPDAQNFGPGGHTLNQLIRKAGINTSTSPYTASRAYDALVDLFAALPYDGCSQPVYNPPECPYNPDASYADSGHFNPIGAKILADYFTAVAVTRGAGIAPRLPAWNWNFTFGTHGSAAPLFGHDHTVLDVNATYDAQVVYLSGAAIFAGSSFVVRNTGTTYASLSLNGTSAKFEETGDMGTGSIGPFLAPGEQRTYHVAQDSASSNPVLYIAERSFNVPHNNFLSGKICVASADGQGIDGTCDFFDTNGHVINLNQGNNGYDWHKQRGYHKVLVVNRAATATTFQQTTVPINGNAGVSPLPPHGMAWAVTVPGGSYYADISDWLIQPFGVAGFTGNCAPGSTIHVANGLITGCN